MKHKYSIVMILMLAVCVLASGGLTAQQAKTHLSGTISGADGHPLAGASVFGGGAFTTTDSQGRFSISVTEGTKVVIEQPGYQSRTLSIAEVKDNPEVQLKVSKATYALDHTVHLPFHTEKERDVVGFVSNLDMADLNSYDHTIWLGNMLQGRLLGVIDATRMRGIGRGITVEDLTNSGTGTLTYVVDGLPRDINDMRASEVASISVLRDVNSAVLYGSDAVNGIVLITTKRGEAYKKHTDFSVNYGISSPRELPKYLNSADYMTYFNTARANDGLTPQFSDETIQDYKTGNRYRYPDVDYYSSQYLKPVKNYFDVDGQFSGGNDVAKYYANLGWNSTGSLLNFGEGAKARTNIFNVRGNVDLKINDKISTNVDVAGFFGDAKGPQGNYWSDAASIRPYEYTPLLPISLITPDNELLLGRKNDVNGLYLLGGNSNHITTPFGDGYSGGVNEVILRKFTFNNRVDVDMSSLTPGLSFHTNISFDYIVGYNQTVSNSYSVYEPEWNADGDSIISLTQYGKDSRPGTQSVGGSYFRRRFGAYGMFSYDRRFGNHSRVSGSLLGYLSNFKEQGDFQGIKQAHAGLRLAYSYQDAYVIDFSGVMLNSVKLAEGHRAGFSPTVGLNWIISSEPFLADSKNVNFLKLRLSGGILNTDFLINGFFYYDDRYATSGSYNWYEGGKSRSGVASSWGRNDNLTYTKRNEVNLGLEGSFFGNVLGGEINAFYDVYNNLIARPSTIYPAYYTDFIPYENFGANEYHGLEFGLHVNKSVGKWNIYVGANLLYTDSKVQKLDEVYDNAYQYHKGHPADANYGLQALGLFQDQADIDNSPTQTFGAVVPGDIKYKDQNGDGVVDDNDQVYLGRYQAPWSGGLTVKVSYGAFTLFALGHGASGSVGFKSGDYYWVDGNTKYSDVVLGAWTPDTKATATYPRLSSQTNSNDFRTSSYWMYNDNYFEIDRVQLTYHLKRKASSNFPIKEADVFVDASDITQFAKNKKIRDLHVAAEPYYRTFSVGVNANF